MNINVFRGPVLLGLGFVATLMSSCATLPSSGPTAHQITRGAKTDRNTIGFQIVGIDPSVVAAVAQDDINLAARQSSFTVFQNAGTNDVVGPGDELQISIFEVGVSLFGAGTDLDASARGQALPPITVGRDGTITLPYAGRIVVAGDTTTQIAHKIEVGLRSISQKPQALVTVRGNSSNTYVLFGEVRKPGRYPLTLGRERLVDAIAIGGGSAASAEDTIVRVTRGRQVVEERLGRIRAGDPGDFQIMQSDRIELIKRPRTFLILGASGKVSQIAFETGDVSLAEAVARAGGPADAAADPSAVFLFRYVREAQAGPAVQPKPVIYRLNMNNPVSYFLSQKFLVRDKDVIYIGNAAANQPSKLISVINQLFSPAVTAKVLTQ